jgi:hypothetical protein
VPPTVSELRCAERSEHHGEQLAGTASRFRRFLLLERPVGWGHDALAESGLDPGLVAGLQERTAHLDIRIQLIRRRQGRYAAPGPTCVLASTEPGASFLEHVRLPRPEAVLELDLEGFAAGRPSGAGSVSDGPLWLVCTHGTKDPCCAARGLPVARALKAAGEQVWQSSHLGGDRFAANVVCLPHGVALGRVPAARARAVAARLRAGVVPLDLLRGRVGWPGPVQAAEIALRRELGLDALDAVIVEDAESDDDGVWTVRLGTPGDGAHEARVRQEPVGAAWLVSCKKTKPEDPGGWTVLTRAAACAS